MLPWLIRFLFVAGAARLARLYRTTAAQRAQSDYLARFATGPDGIVQGAEPFTLVAPGGRWLLLLHGSGDTPQTLRFLGEQLHAAGYSVHAPLLPGHGRSPAAFATVDESQYRASAHEALDLVRGQASWIGVVGLSMGGALAVPLAAESSDVRALVLLAPYLEPPSLVRWVARTSWLWGAVVPFVGGRGEASVQDVSARGESRAYGTFSPRALRALVATADAGRRALAAVDVPALVVHSREDIRIPTVIGERSTAALRGPAERHWVAGCGHIITVDSCKHEVAALVLDFLGRLTQG